MSPYKEALDWAERHPSASSGTKLKMLILSLYSGDCAFSIRECIGGLDHERTNLALRMVEHFARHGEDQELAQVGSSIRKHYPRLWDLGEASFNAKRALEEQWQAEDQAKG